MIHGQRNRALWLGATVVAGAGLLAVQAYITAPADGGMSQPAAVPSHGATAGVPLTSVEEVRVNRLAHVAPALPEHTRDPFRYRQAPPPPSSIAAPVRRPPVLGPPSPLPPPPAPAAPPANPAEVRGRGGGGRCDR